MIAACLVALAAALPWLAVLPLHGAAAVIAEALAVIAACHGAGLAIARLAIRLRGAPPSTTGSPAPPPATLVIQWGLAALIGGSGLAIAAGHGTALAHTGLVLGGAAIHTIVLARRRADYAERVAAALAGPRWWILPWAALAGLGALAMLGAAGETFVQPFNDETHLLAQLRRVLTSGGLDDAIGFPRHAGLGGQVALMAIAAGAGDHLALAIDGLAAVLALGLAVASIRTPAPADATAPVELAHPADAAGTIELAHPADAAGTIELAHPADATAPVELAHPADAAGTIELAHPADATAPVELAHPADATGLDRALWALLVVAAGSALALSTADPLPCWSAAGLVIALHRMLRDDTPPALPLAITAGALATLRHELAVVAAAALVVAWWRSPRDRRRTVVLVLGALAVAAPFVVARALAWRALPPLAQALVAGGPAPALAVRAAITTAIAIPGALVLRLGLRLGLPPGRGLGSAATVTAVALAAIVARLTGGGGYSFRIAIPIALGFLLSLAVELARTRSAGRTAWFLTLVLCVVIHDGSRVGGRRRWSRRLAAAADHIATIDRPASGAAGDYARMLAATPAHATVAIWVAQPELIDYAQRHIVDLHTPAGTRLRVHRWLDHRPAIAQLVAAVSADYLLLEADDARVLHVQTELLYRWLCSAPRPICDDDLEAIARHHPVVAAQSGLRLIDLRSQSEQSEQSE